MLPHAVNGIGGGPHRILSALCAAHETDANQEDKTAGEIDAVLHSDRAGKRKTHLHVERFEVEQGLAPSVRLVAKLVMHRSQAVLECLIDALLKRDVVKFQDLF